MSPGTLKMLLAGLGVVTLVVVAPACGTQETDEPERITSPTVQQATATPQPDPTAPPTIAPSPRTDGNSGALNADPDQHRRSQGKRWRRPQRHLSRR